MRPNKFSKQEPPRNVDLTAYSIEGNVVVLSNTNPVPNTKILVLENPKNSPEYMATTEEYLADVKTLKAGALKKKYPKTYSSWKNMKQRCKNGYVLDSRFDAFTNFLSLMGPRRGEKITIDRKDHTNPNYSPENCRWADKYTQNQNKSNNVLLTYKGEILPASVWARRTNQKPDTVLHRVANGWTDEEAITGIRKSSSHLSMDEARRLCLKKLSSKVIADVLVQIFFEIRAIEQQLVDCYNAYEERGAPIPPELEERLLYLRSIRRDFLDEINCRYRNFDMVNYANEMRGGVSSGTRRGTYSDEYKGFVHRLRQLTGGNAAPPAQ